MLNLMQGQNKFPEANGYRQTARTGRNTNRLTKCIHKSTISQIDEQGFGDYSDLEDQSQYSGTSIPRRREKSMGKFAYNSYVPSSNRKSPRKIPRYIQEQVENLAYQPSSLRPSKTQQNLHKNWQVQAPITKSIPYVEQRWTGKQSPVRSLKLMSFK